MISFFRIYKKFLYDSAGVFHVCPRFYMHNFVVHVQWQGVILFWCKIQLVFLLKNKTKKWKKMIMKSFLAFVCTQVTASIWLFVLCLGSIIKFNAVISHLGYLMNIFLKLFYIALSNIEHWADHPISFKKHVLVLFCCLFIFLFFFKKPWLKRKFSLSCKVYVTTAKLLLSLAGFKIRVNSTWDKYQRNIYTVLLLSQNAVAACENLSTRHDSPGNCVSILWLQNKPK